MYQFDNQDGTISIFSDPIQCYILVYISSQLPFLTTPHYEIYPITNKDTIPILMETSKNMELLGEYSTFEEAEAAKITYEEINDLQSR